MVKVCAPFSASKHARAAAPTIFSLEIVMA